MECGKEKLNERKCNFTSLQLPQEAAASPQGCRRGLSLATLPAHRGRKNYPVTLMETSHLEPRLCTRTISDAGKNKKNLKKQHLPIS